MSAHRDTSGTGAREDPPPTEPEQLLLVPVVGPGRRRARSTAPAADRPLADPDPVAVVLVDTPLAHLDRPFEYVVPAELGESARPGARVRVRLAGRDHDGFVLERRAVAEHTGRLTPLRSVVSPESVLTPAVAAAARAVADHYGGTLADVVRLAVPPRHARAERSVPGPTSEDAAVTVPDQVRQDSSAGSPAQPGPWDRYPAGPAFLRRLGAGQAPTAAWTALPAQPPQADWPAAVAEAVAATLRGGRGAVVVVPDRRDVERVVRAVEDRCGPESCVRLTADLGPDARYRAFLRALRGLTRVVVGTRAAAWAPVHDPGLFVCWDDGDDLHQEPRAPYPHVREVLRHRARTERAGLLLGGLARTPQVEVWARDGELARVEPLTAVVRSASPRVLVAGEGRAEERDPAARSARIPTTAWLAVREGLEHGPVLVQVPRQGYVVSLTCAEPGCRTPVRCRRCEGPVGAVGGGGPPSCRWCGAPHPQTLGCRACGSPRQRAGSVGADRTAEELGRAFPGTRVVSSSGEHVVSHVDARPVLVVATPGAEPVAEGGYRAVLLLDGWRLLDRAVLDAGTEALRRWMTAAALCTPRADEVAAPGRSAPTVVVCGVPAHAGVPAVESLVRWDPVGLAAREVDERAELGLPPVRRHATVRGPLEAVREVADSLRAAGHDVLGAPSTAGGDVDQATFVVREGAQASLAETVRAVRSGRSARRASEVVRVQLDASDPLS
ncbi:primosome assembly protein PriA [Ornithinimicrobium tianjinense]|uniref:Probable replication restart protein PriA n=1 Tax=Ornithinimicrobium tianjinense TaxID=1195761 RepID=A0A917F4V9_9MICO|nr:primosome assembly protein PriA [Ornithinimicrobium tianjinense]GGF48384.1 putative primosomal protein N' [Ornithinimicrobium tianjinense]